ncbi:MAG: bifunctional ornithine acetyltransferase/N-acetylglutamate synthase, partial [Spirochaetaceae bacterium]|nr:bifunctional ornithine acetyltransferase/N-acetylglutamate synthase [Spirochaetaceae bacterium]
MNKFSSNEEHEKFLKEQCIFPLGFSCSVQPLSFFPQEKKLEKPFPMNLTLITLDNASDSFAGVFTSNAFPGHPVVLGKKLIKESLCQGIFINNKISNVCTKGGMEDSLTLQKSIEKELAAEGFILPSSTGIIGWKLPVDQMQAQ